MIGQANFVILTNAWVDINNGEGPAERKIHELINVDREIKRVQHLGRTVDVMGGG